MLKHLQFTTSRANSGSLCFGPSFLLRCFSLSFPKYALCAESDPTDSLFATCLWFWLFLFSIHPSLLSPASLQGHIPFLTLLACFFELLQQLAVIPHLVLNYSVSLFSSVLHLWSVFYMGFLSSVIPLECLGQNWAHGGSLILRNEYSLVLLYLPLKLNNRTGLLTFLALWIWGMIIWLKADYLCSFTSFTLWLVPFLFLSFIRLLSHHLHTAYRLHTTYISLIRQTIKGNIQVKQETCLTTFS